MEPEPGLAALAKLHELGLTIEIESAKAARIWATLLIIDGRLSQGLYHKGRDPNAGWHWDHFHDLYHAIAKETVHADTPDEVLEVMIPRMVEAFRLREKWMPNAPEAIRQQLQGAVAEWKGKRMLMTLAVEHETPTVARAREPSTCAQLRRLREESHMSFEELAEAIGVQPRSVYRHFAGEALPHRRHLAKYQEVFSERLGRKVLISQTSGKCQ